MSKVINHVGGRIGRNRPRGPVEPVLANRVAIGLTSSLFTITTGVSGVKVLYPEALQSNDLKFKVETPKKYLQITLHFFLFIDRIELGLYLG